MNVMDSQGGGHLYREDPTFTPGIFVKIHRGKKLIVMTVMSGGVNRRSGGSRRNIQRIFRKINYDES